MFGKFGRKKSADTLTLEVIGVITGAEQFDLGKNNSKGTQIAHKYARDLDRIIQRNRRVMDSDTLQFLRDSHRHFKSLAKTASSIAEGPIMSGPMPGVAVPLNVKPNPDWQEKFTAFRDEMRGAAAQVFEKQYLPGFRALPAYEPTKEQELAGRIIMSLR